MARSERTRSPRNGGASAGQRAVRSRPRSALRQDQLTPSDQAEFVLCEQTILAVSRPIMLMPIAGGSLVRTLSRPASWHIDAVAGRPPHLLGLELDDPGFDHSVLCEFRARLLEGGAEERLLHKLLEACQARGLLKARGRQRSDTTHVLAAIRTLNRLELVGETLRAALNEL